MNENSKPWYLSKGFVGPLVTAILFSLRNLGIVDVDADTALGVIYQFAEFSGVITAMAGRALAQKRLTLGVDIKAMSFREASATKSAVKEQSAPETP
ncbi:MAG: hypothetical protein IPK66_02775 [Rhodospirillales bacterium]|nr:hypothetical protein [Rhodospirillales bacterium]